jgi:hypothetical protein
MGKNKRGKNIRERERKRKEEEKNKNKNYNIIFLKITKKSQIEFIIKIKEIIRSKHTHTHRLI